MSKAQIQSTLVISNSLISNNRLSRSENLVPVETQRASRRQQNIMEKRRNCSLGSISPLFHNIFNISLNLVVKLHIHSVKVFVRLIVSLSSANLICRSTDISKCFIESLGVRDNESRLYVICCMQNDRPISWFPKGKHIVAALSSCQTVARFCLNHITKILKRIR